MSHADENQAFNKVDQVSPLEDGKKASFGC